jgi:hypothetical protein
MTREERFDLLKEVCPVGVKREQGIVEISLKHTVRTIHRAVAEDIDHVVPTADMIGCSWARFEVPSVKRGDEEVLFPHSDGIREREKLFDQNSLIRNPFNRESGKILQNIMGHPIVLRLFVKINLFDLKGKHRWKPEMSNDKVQSSNEIQMAKG